MDESSEGNRRDRQVLHVIGVYDADGTLWGEVAYWVGARLGRRHCSLCDVTHGAFTEKSEWKKCRATLPVPFETFHRNDQPDDVRQASRDRAPVIVARTDRETVVLLDDHQITATNGDPEALIAAIERAAGTLGLTWT